MFDFWVENRRYIKIERMSDKGRLNNKCNQAEFEYHDVLLLLKIDIDEGLWPEKQGSQHVTYPDHVQLTFISYFLLDFPTNIEFFKLRTFLVSFQPLTTIQLINGNENEDR